MIKSFLCDLERSRFALIFCTISIGITQLKYQMYAKQKYI